MLRDTANGCRFAPASTAGHYESYFLRANHPQRPLAFWIRYTFFSPRGRPAEAGGEVWAVMFDGERGAITATKDCFPLAACSFTASGLDMAIGAARLDGSSLSGSTGGRLRWQLGYSAPQPPLLLQPEAMVAGSFPKAKALVAAPGAIFTGSLQVDGAALDIDGWVGSQNHNWGSRHTDSYAWGQVAGFDDGPEVFLECATARLKVGPFWTPPLTLVVLRIGLQEFSLNSLAQAVRTRAQFGFFHWEIDARAKDVRIRISMHAERAAFAGLRYPNPPGGVKTCLNSKLASCVLTIEQHGQPARTYTTAHRAAFEILTDRQDHGVALLA